MKKSIYLIAITLILAFVTLFLPSCANSEKKQQEIIDTFASFENSEQYILITLNEIHIGKKIISIDDIKYNEEPCNIIISKEDGAYAYSYDPESDLSINIVFVEYDTLSVTLLSNIQLPNKIIATEHYNNSLYFRMLDPESDADDQIYLMYDISTKQTQTVDTDDIPFEIERSGDHNRSEMFYITKKSSLLENRLLITKKDTGEAKIIDNSLLYTCPEGEAITKLGKNDLGSGCSEAFEKQGDIYVVFAYITDGSWGNPCHYYIMKYDFESHTFEYYTSIFFEVYPEEILDIYIP